MENLILIIIGLLCCWYIYNRIFKSNGCHGNCGLCSDKSHDLNKLDGLENEEEEDN